MKLYLSSYKIGDEPDKLTGLFSANKRVGYVPNALDFTGADPERRKRHIESDIASLVDIGLEPELLDLREYFWKRETLENKIRALGGLWISGGNVFILRQAMKLSDLDTILETGSGLEDFVYGGYSAAGCVLSKSLRGYELVDDATDFPYDGQMEMIWDGLGLIDFAFLPHFDSEHPESAGVGDVKDYCIKNGIPYKTLRDGEALVIE
jgi:dipeptidase E